MVKNRLFVFLGVTAIGKTFWMENLLKRYPNLRRIKNTTTRPQRPGDLTEDHSYNFVTAGEFIGMIEDDKFLEHAMFRGYHYGSTPEAIEDVLRDSHGVFALTTSGVLALRDYRGRWKITLIYLRPADDDVLRQNLNRRGICRDQEQDELIAKQKEFYIPSGLGVRTYKVDITGKNDQDGPIIRGIFDYSMYPD